MHNVRVMRTFLGVMVIVLAIGVSGCGSGSDKTPTATSAPATQRPTASASQPSATTASVSSTQNRQINGPTCRDWVALDNNLSLEDRVAGKENKEQQDLLKQMLDKHGKDTGESNRLNAELAIIQFCFPDDTGTRPNNDQPIEDAIAW